VIALHNGRCIRCGAPELINPVAIDAVTTRLRPDPSVCVEFELEVTTLANSEEGNYSFRALPCASLLLLLRGKSVSLRSSYGGNSAEEEYPSRIEEGSVLFLSAHQVLSISADVEPGEEVIVFRAHVNLGSL
jgi:hypothetical protein